MVRMGAEGELVNPLVVKAIEAGEVFGRNPPSHNPVPASPPAAAKVSTDALK